MIKRLSNNTHVQYRRTALVECSFYIEDQDIGMNYLKILKIHLIRSPLKFCRSIYIKQHAATGFV